MLNSRGLRLSVAGAVVVGAGMLSLLVLPGAIAGAAMMIGAVAVIGGFAWTMAEYYGSPADSDDE